MSHTVVLVQLQTRIHVTQIPARKTDILVLEAENLIRISKYHNHEVNITSRKTVPDDSRVEH